MSWIRIIDRRFNFGLIRDYMLQMRGDTYFIILNDIKGKDIPIRCDDEEQSKRIMATLDAELKRSIA